MNEPRKNSAPYAIALAILVLVPALYFVAYAAIGQRWTMRVNPRRQSMNFPYDWVAAFFQPAAKVDSVIFQTDVDAIHDEQFSTAAQRINHP